MSEPLLRCDRVTKRFGGLKAVCDVSILLRTGELVGLIGPNGAGKTTCFNLITGADVVTSGAILFDGRDITTLPAPAHAGLGIARTFQNIRLWRDMTALDNVRAVLQGRPGSGLPSAVLRLPAFRRAERAITEEALDALRRLDLDGLAGARAGDLPYGDQRRLEIARALALRPRLLLLDEPAAGMTPAEKAELMATVRRLRDELRLTVLLIEHDMKFVMGICERIYVLDHGDPIAEGTPDEIRKDPKVIRAYLGAAAC